MADRLKQRVKTPYRPERVESEVDPGAQGYDQETEAMLFHGASLTQIARLFGKDSRDVKAKLSGNVAPIGSRRGHPIFSLAEAAPYLVTPPYDMQEFIERMTIADLPPILRKEFWNGMLGQQRYMKEAGELWPTSDVEELIITLMKSFRLAAMVTREQISREFVLTDKQREAVARSIDSALENAHAAVMKQFGDKKNARQKSDDSDQSFEEDGEIPDS